MKLPKKKSAAQVNETLPRVGKFIWEIYNTKKPMSLRDLCGAMGISYFNLNRRASRYVAASHGLVKVKKFDRVNYYIATRPELTAYEARELWKQKEANKKKKKPIRRSYPIPAYQ
jgi:hypothetical protein